MDTAMHVLTNMNELGYIKNDSEVSGSILSNDGSILIEMTRTKSDMHSLWSSTPNDDCYSSRVTISFKDALTKRTLLDIHTNPGIISSMLDSIESWISFNYSYDCICPLDYTDIMGNTYEFSFTIMNANNQYAFPIDPLDRQSNQFPYKYFLDILQYNPVEERMIFRLKIELEEVSDVDENSVQNNGNCTLYDFCDMLFYVTFYNTEIYDTEWKL